MHVTGLGRNLSREAKVRTSSQLPAASVEWCNVARVTIDLLPDLALLEIFDFYVDETGLQWHALVHVCRKWRKVVFGSPRRLGLKLRCKAGTPVRETLDAWPPLPIIIELGYCGSYGVDSITAALEHNDRIYQLDFFDFLNSKFEKVLAAMQQPFPTLKHLRLSPMDGKSPLDPFPASFLGGSVPHLQTLRMGRIPFPELPKLLLSATHLVDLRLFSVPYSGYISPEVMVTCLSVLTKLETLFIEFPHLERRSSPLQTRTLLPILSKLWFKGAGGYLEDLVARIDAPLLHNFDVTFHHERIFNTPRLAQFISRTPKLMAYDNAHVFFSGEHNVSVTLSQASNREFQLRISNKISSDQQASSLAQICGLSFLRGLITNVEHLYILVRDYGPSDIENDEWLEILHPFTAVKDLYMDMEFNRVIPHALQELIGEGITEVLPALQTLFFQDTTYVRCSQHEQDAIGQFVAARRLARLPVTVSPWYGDHGR